MAKSPEEKRLAAALKMRKWRAKNPERAKAQTRHDAAKHRAKDPDAYNAYMRQWNSEHREQINQNAMDDYHIRQGRRTHDPELDAHLRALSQARNARWNAAHPEEYKAIQQAYKATHKEQSNARRRERRAENPEPVQAMQARRYARKKGAPGEGITAEEWQTMKHHYGYRCVYCGTKPKTLTRDHITPLSAGGANTLSNIVPACRSCNSRKNKGPILAPVQPLLLL